MKKIIKINYLLYSVIFFILSIVILIFNESFYKIVIISLLIILGLDTLKNILFWIIHDKKSIHILIINIFMIIFITFMINNKNIPYSIFPFLTGLYIIMNGIIKSISTYNLFITKENGKLFNIIISLIFYAIGISLMLSPLIHLKAVLIIFGIYTMILSLNNLHDFINDTLNKNNKRRIHICLPTFIDALIPYNYLKKIDNIDENLSINKRNAKPDIEILIHVSKNKNGKMGHVDFIFNNIVYSYGNYDHSSYKLFNTIGDGVLIKSEKKEYIKFCIEDSNKTLFSYGIKLSNKQKKDLKNKLNQVEKNIYSWTPSTNNNYYAERLNKKTKSSFYKFKKGKYKKYFLLNNNCAYFADKILNVTGTDIIKISGLITPGTYQEYLNKELNKKNGIVISLNIYNNKTYKNLSLND